MLDLRRPVPIFGTRRGEVFMLILVMSWFSRVRARMQRGHARRLRAASRVLQRVSGFDDARMISYLRKTDPLALEELVLDAALRDGATILRNLRYTGDGGIDGRFYLDGKLVLVQAKRYSGAINSRHVVDFVALCGRENCAGIFVHTGSTPATVYGGLGSVKIVSGSKLTKWIRGEISVRQLVSPTERVSS